MEGRTRDETLSNLSYLPARDPGPYAPETDGPNDLANPTEQRFTNPTPTLKPGTVPKKVDPRKRVKSLRPRTTRKKKYGGTGKTFATY